MVVDQGLRCITGNDASTVEDGDTIAQGFGFIHVVGGEYQRAATLMQPAQDAPHVVPRLRVEARRRFVENDQFRIVNERAGQRQPPPHAAGECRHFGVASIGQLDVGEQFIGSPLERLAAQAEIARIGNQVFYDGEIDVEGVELGYDAEARADVGCVIPHAGAKHLDFAFIVGRKAEQHTKGRGLARAIGPENAEEFAT